MQAAGGIPNGMLEDKDIYVWRWPRRHEFLGNTFPKDSDWRLRTSQWWVVMYIYVRICNLLQICLVKMLNTKSDTAIPFISIYVCILDIICPFAMDDDSDTGTLCLHTGIQTRNSQIASGFGTKGEYGLQIIGKFGLRTSRKVSAMVWL